jgi:phosphatidylglycerophosphate synthase/putative flippase GtrA
MDRITNMLLGELSPNERIWTALAPAVALVVYFIGGVGVYAIRYAFKGPFRDAELEKRESTVLTGKWIRMYFVWVMQPLWRVVWRSGIPANAITTLSLLISIGSGVALAAGRFGLGGWLYIFAGICDYLDGRVARLRGSNSTSGAALDSILDRYSDSAILVGLAWYYRDSWVLIPTLAALVGSSLVPYIRARGEIVGINMTIGMMQRAERILYLGAPVSLSPVLEAILDPSNPRPTHRLAIAGILLLAVSTQLTAFQRLVHLLAALKKTVSNKRSVKHTLPRNIAAAAVATAFDFLVMSLLVNGGLLVPLATGIGCLFGGVLNFSLNRLWTFQSKSAKLPQIWRYAFVSWTSALLNSGGVAIMLLLPDLDYRPSWLLVRLAVFVTWNFPLHRDYVFVPDSAKSI